MKVVKTIFIGSLFFAVVGITISYGCKKKTTACSTTGTSVNIGSTGGGGFSQNVSSTLQCTYTLSYNPTQTVTYNDVLSFDNTTLNFTCSGSPTTSTAACAGVGGTIMDVGAQTCLSNVSGNPTANTVAYTNGHGYIAKYPDGHTLKFIAGTYASGSVSVSYLFQ
ncbi:MAG TPA: hypothetical protein VF411_09180 [Bacteroidia bacterium]